MVNLKNSLQFWRAEDFQGNVKREIEDIDPSLLPLQQGLSQGSHVVDEPIKAMIIKISEEKDSVKVKAGIFFQSIIAGCSCSDDPTPIDTNQEYCELEFIIDISSGEATVKLLED
jgi:hypothetical protein